MFYDFMTNFGDILWFVWYFYTTLCHFMAQIQSKNGNRHKKKEEKSLKRETNLTFSHDILTTVIQTFVKNHMQGF